LLKIPGPGKNILENHAFFIGSNGNHSFLLAPLRLLVVPYFQICGASVLYICGVRKGPEKFFMVALESLEKF